MTTATVTPLRFDIALSFPGEHRDYVKEVAAHLAEKFTEERVLYDHYHDAEFARFDLDVYLPALYKNNSELIVIFLCPEYAAKRWCNLEWRYIRQMIATADAKRIMFLSFGNPGNLSDIGILGGDGYIDVSPLTPQVASEKIIKRLGINQGIVPPSKPVAPISADISRIDKYAPAELIGREAETKVLNDAWKQSVSGEAKRPHVLTFVALGGEGKTSLVAKWAAELAHDNWPGCEAAFAWSFYSQGTHEVASSDLFLKEALVFFGDVETANSTQSAYDKGRRLAKLVGECRALLILDGVEPLQYAPTSSMPGELKDHGIAALLKGLAANSLGLCVVTTRYSISDLKNYWETTAPKIDLKRLSKEAGVALLKSLGVIGSQPEFEQLVEDVRGHALTLNLLGAYLRDAHAGDIRKRDLVKLADADDEQGGHAFRVMDVYARWFESGGKSENENVKGRRALAVLRLLGLFDRPVTADCFSALLKAPAIPNLTELLVEKNEAKLNMAFTRLMDAKLITMNRDAAGSLIALDAHPLLREYFAKQIRDEHPGPWREAHRRLYKHLISTTNEGAQPTLEKLQPLYQAVAHGCQAGMQQEVCKRVYYERILKGEKFYSARQLGAFGSNLGAVASFFEKQWSRVTPEISGDLQVLLLNEAAIFLRALGRLTDALEPMQAGLQSIVSRKSWAAAATIASNLSELELTLGEVDSAVSNAEQSVVYADRSEDVFQKMHRRARLADALQQIGRSVEAEANFREAEGMQSDFSLLYSMSGFHYCDLLLAKSERAAWIAFLSSPEEGGRAKNDEVSPYFVTLSAVHERVAQTLDLAMNRFKLGLLSIAVDHLTLGRIALYEVILNNSASPTSHAASELDEAVDGLRRSGNMDIFPRGLITRAWLHGLDGSRTGSVAAQANLNEAWEIAERGPMPLFMADIHLYRARLFFREAAYPWESPQADLAEARRLIEKHGYWRRKEELEDAESVILRKS